MTADGNVRMKLQRKQLTVSMHIMMPLSIVSFDRRTFKNCPKETPTRRKHVVLTQCSANFMKKSLAKPIYGHVLMTGGNLKDIYATKKETLTARDSIEYYRNENKGIARGNAIATIS